MSGSEFRMIFKPLLDTLEKNYKIVMVSFIILALFLSFFELKATLIIFDLVAFVLGLLLGYFWWRSSSIDLPDVKHLMMLYIIVVLVYALSYYEIPTLAGVMKTIIMVSKDISIAILWLLMGLILSLSYFRKKNQIRFHL